METRDLNPEAQKPEEQPINEAQTSAEPAAEAQAPEQNTEIETVVEPDGAPADPEEAAEAEAAEAYDEADEEAEVRVLTADELIAVARELEQKDPAELGADEIRRLRQQANALHKRTIDQARKAHEEAHEEGEFVEPQENAELAELIAAVREHKNQWAARQEAQRMENLRRKNEIVAEILSLAEDTDNVNRTFPRYRELQDEFNAIGEVPPTEDTALWKRFQDARERFSDNLKINKELRDYDFKKNLDSKNLILSEAIALNDEADVIVAYRRLQELHNKWRQIGPVAKELREEIWIKFKDASAEVNKRYQAFFEERKAKEAENEAAKTALCEKLEEVKTDEIKTYKGWEEATAAVMALQAEWKQLGFASRKANRALFARFRKACDEFFAAKAAYYKSTRDELAANLAKKTALCERAEELMNSTEWRKTTDELVELQRQWKAVGAVAKKYSDSVWKRFQTACDKFFEEKKKATSGTRQTEGANLKAKLEIIGKLEAISADSPREEAIELMHKLQDEWQQIGHVPFREKDKVYEAYRSCLDALRQRLDLRERGARMERFSRNVSEIEGDDNKLYRERERLLRQLEAKRGELRTYDNNLGFLKGADGMLREFAKKMERLKADITTLEEQIKLIDSKLS